MIWGFLEVQVYLKLQKEARALNEGIYTFNYDKQPKPLIQDAIPLVVIGSPK